MSRQVERAIRFVALAKMSIASAADALKTFSNALKGVHETLRKTLRHKHVNEVKNHATLTLCTGAHIYCTEPHDP